MNYWVRLECETMLLICAFPSLERSLAFRGWSRRLYLAVSFRGEDADYFGTCTPNYHGNLMHTQSHDVHRACLLEMDWVSQKYSVGHFGFTSVAEVVRIFLKLTL
jgi:hypothetical protein